jgi:spermidine synthase
MVAALAYAEEPARSGPKSTQPKSAQPKPAASERVVRSFVSKFGTIYVVDEGELRSLRFDDPDAAEQTVIHLRDPDAVPLEYIRTSALGLSLVDQPKDALMIGLGGGAFVRVVRRWVPELHVDAVEIDPVVVEVARTWFGVDDGPRTKLVVDDGARYLKRTRKKWDLIFLDAYSGDAVPSHLATREFFDRVRARLRPGGVVVMNVAVEERVLERRLVRRFARSFPGCSEVTEPEWGNVLLFGTVERAGHEPARLVERADRFARARALPFRLVDAAASATACVAPRR